MGRNLILCADGTGNKGGYTPESNVYKTYNMVDIHDQGQEQLTYYDNGVGTSQNKIWRALGGAFGMGFKRNVCDLYRFLAKNYHPGDNVYLFGFSRGAATIRAFTGMVSTCGLIDGRKLSSEELEEQVKNVFQAYRNKPTAGKLPKSLNQGHGVIDIKFVGLWDTVSALGFPKRTERIGPITTFIATLFALLDVIWDIIGGGHKFYQYELFPNIRKAYQALSIDDARTSFWPLVWDESNRKRGSVEQVWFAGMHSNVGGGYERQGLANVTLYWMLVRAQKHGLLLKEGALSQVEADSNIHGRLYDSRDGLGMFYRFHPRNIEALCEDKMVDPIRIHKTVLTRMKFRTAEYGPANMPGSFCLVQTEPGAEEIQLDPGKNQDWPVTKNRIRSNFYNRLKAYWLLIFFSALVVVKCFQTWSNPPEQWGRSGLSGHLADIMNYVLPDFCNGAVELYVAQNPFVFIAFLVFVSCYWIMLSALRKKTANYGTTIRNMVMATREETK